MRIEIEIGFAFDARGRMLRTNDPREDARRPAPRLVVGHTSEGDVVRFNADVSDSVVQEVEAIIATADELMRSQTIIRELLTSPAASPGFRSGPAYYCARAPLATLDAVHITAANHELARDTYPWLYDEVADWQPCFAIVRDGSAVSICFSSRSGPNAAEAGVDTLPEFRGRGFASAATAAWATAVSASGRIAFYSTSWDNLASQRVARRVGLDEFGEHLSWL